MIGRTAYCKRPTTFLTKKRRQILSVPIQPPHLHAIAAAVAGFNTGDLTTALARAAHRQSKESPDR